MFFFTFTRDVYVYARDAFEAKREKETREYVHTRARHKREYSIQNYSYKQKSFWIYVEKKRNNVETMMTTKKPTREREIERNRESDNNAHPRSSGSRRRCGSFMVNIDPSAGKK